ncbi:MAG: type II toxin-antitoxin system RelE/ParE family toxin [Magnetococcales bacterium]|nr:type II toxin-antitoxin system RelE/ParE family toxin [Magnetococcales bacterium]
MYEIIQSAGFKTWLAGLKDRQAAMRIHVRLDRARLGNFGDVKPVREGISEMRMDYGPGYRVYFMRRGQVMVILLAGGDKTSQDADIERAVTIARGWRD